MSENDVTKDLERSTRLTYEGLNLLAGCQLGAELRFTRVVMGNGDIVEGQDIRELADLVNPILELPIVFAKATGVGTVKVGAKIDNTDLKTGFFAKEVGIFAQNGEDGKEILYAYRNTGAQSEYIPAGGGSEPWNLIYDVITVIDQADNITAVFNGEASYVDMIEFMNHEESENPHPNFLQKGKEVTTANNLVCGLSEDSRELNHISMDNLKRQMLGDISDIPLLNSRVRQLERENANLALKMEAENMMPDCNMLLAENFVTPDSIDRLEIQVTSCAAGDDSIDVETNYGFIVGSHYWITDGVHAEYVQVKSVIKNGSIYRIILEKPLVETYLIEATKIYRTTAWISESGVVYGSGDVLGATYKNDTVWKGTTAGGTAESNVKLDTSLDNADNFELDNVVFNANNLVTF